MIRLPKIAAVFTLTAFFIAGCGMSSYNTYSSWDEDGDNYIDNTEFVNVYDQAGYYEAWDLDNDGLLDEAEWARGFNEYYGSYDAADYGYYEEWDLNNNGFISQDEYYEGAWNYWDINGDGYIGTNEYNQYYYDMQYDML